MSETPGREPAAIVWRCFHCDEVFTVEHEARAHFGFDPCSDPACKIKMGAEKSLVTALRRAEKDAADAWAAIHNETTDSARAYHAQASRHQEQLRAAEELGYERGLRDAPEALRAEKEELRRERDEARAKAEKDLREAGAHFAKSCEMADRALTAESLLAEAGKALEPFAKSFDGRRDAHSRRHADRDLGYARFDKMPDEWPIEPAVFSMGAYRRARSVSTRIASLAISGAAPQAVEYAR